MRQLYQTTFQDLDLGVQAEARAMLPQSEERLVLLAEVTGCYHTKIIV
jgi:hypothetical protein